MRITQKEIYLMETNSLAIISDIIHWTRTKLLAKPTDLPQVTVNIIPP